MKLAADDWSRPGALGYMSKEAKRAARAIAGELA